MLWLLTVDTITGGNRERDLRTGFTSPPKLTLSSLFSFATKPMWGINYLTKGNLNYLIFKILLKQEQALIPQSEIIFQLC